MPDPSYGPTLPDAHGASVNELEIDERLRDLEEQLEAESDMGALTDNTGGSVDGTLAAVSGSGADATINDNFADLAAKVNAIRTALQNLGLME